jgi:hypothetical protein
MSLKRELGITFAAVLGSLMRKKNGSCRIKTAPTQPKPSFNVLTRRQNRQYLYRLVALAAAETVILIS